MTYSFFQPHFTAMYHLRLLASALAFAGGIHAQVDLGTASSFAVLGGTTVTNTGETKIDGDVGVAPGTAVTGFTSGTVTNGELHTGDDAALQAQEDVAAAYQAAAAMSPDTDLTGKDLDNARLVAGVYYFGAAADISGELVLDGEGDSNSVWVFQIGSTLTTETATSVKLLNGASACNVFWQVGSSATIANDTAFVGSVLALTSITMVSGASSDGGLYAHNGAVTLDTNKISAPAA